MGQTCCRCFPLMPGRRALSILVVGLDQSGKSSMVSSLQLKPWQPQPTTHFSKPTLILYKEVVLRFYDLGGRLELRKSWTEYLHEVHALVFVVDATHHGRHNDAAMALRHLLQHPCGKDKHVLVLANKQDLEGALSSEELAFKLSLEQYEEPLVQTYPCRSKIYSGARAADWRLEAGLNWLVSAVTADFAAIDRRVRRDRANSAKAQLRTDSLSSSSADPFQWKTVQTRSRGRSFAKATLAAFEQVTSRRWGGTVMPIRRTLPSDVPEGDMEEYNVQNTENPVAEQSGLCDSERSFSIDSDGQPHPAQGGINGDWAPTGDVDYDTVQLVRARWKALGLLWPDEDMCRSVASGYASVGTVESASVSDSVQAEGAGPSHGMHQDTVVPRAAMAQGGEAQPVGVGGPKLHVRHGSLGSAASRGDAQKSSHTHSESLPGEICSIASGSPRSKVRLPPVLAWGSNENLDGAHGSGAPSSPDRARARSHAGTFKLIGEGELVEQRGASVSSPGHHRRPKTIRFA
eukprot:jgi/Ulvmu1/8844/UM049_0025.1